MATALELLAECAGLAQHLAHTYCAAGPQADGSCLPTHAAWPSARLVGLVASPSQDAPYWRDACSRISPLGDRLRVLISGAADHGIADVVHAALATQPCAAEITVIDRCETPLKINQWYASRVRAVLQTQCQDILTFDPDIRYDLICSHGFIDQLPAARWFDVVRCWHRLLRPGGIAIAINRLATPTNGHAAKQAPDLPALIATANEALSPAYRLPLEPTREILQTYWANRRPAQFQSASQITALYERAGFVIEHATEASVEVGSSRRRSPRLQLVARRA